MAVYRPPLWLGLLLSYLVVFASSETITQEFTDSYERHPACQSDSTDSFTVSDSSLMNDTKVTAELIGKVITVISTEDINATDISVNLRNIKTNLETGKIHVGVLGLLMSGRSTFLNSLLGKQFLPFSFHYQRANRVNVLHDPSASEGILYTDNRRARGDKEIREVLNEINTETDSIKSTSHNITLKAEFLFMKGDCGHGLEISNIPKLCPNVTIRAVTDAVKEISIFIIILNVQFLKFESDTEIMKCIQYYHPTLFTKLNRVLILVNGYDLVFYDDHLNDIQPHKLSEHVSDFLRNPSILGAVIHPKHIIPMSAKWALKARLWSADPSAFLLHTNARNMYEEAVLLLQRAGYGYIANLKPFSADLEPGDIEAISSCLLDFSQITTVEARLKEMLHTKGPSLLLKAALDDTINELNNVHRLIATKMELERLQTKQEAVASCEKMKSAINNLKCRHVNYVQPPDVSPSEIDDVTEFLKETLAHAVRKSIQTHLKQSTELKDKAKVHSKICSLNPLILQLTNQKLQSSWSSVADILRFSFTEYAKIAISKLKVDLALFASENPDWWPSDNFFNLLTDIDDSDVLVPEFPSTIQLDDNTLSCGHHIITSYRIEFHSVKKKKKKKSSWRSKKKHHEYYVSESYRTTVYSPDIPALLEAFTANATNPSIQLFRSSVDSTIATTSDQLVQAVIRAKEKAFSAAEEEIAQIVYDKRKALESSREKVKQLITSKNTLLMLEDSLQAV